MLKSDLTPRVKFCYLAWKQKLAPMLNSFGKRNVTRCYARKSIQLNLGLSHKPIQLFLWKGRIRQLHLC